MMPFREFQTRLSQTSGDFSRSPTEAWSIRLLAGFYFLTSCFLLGHMYRHFDRNFDPVLKTLLIVVVIGLFSLSYALYRHGNGHYSIRDGEIFFERPKGIVRWRERIADITDVGGSADWFWEKWVVLKFGNRSRRLELLPSLLDALNRAVPPNTSFERTREG